MRPLKTRYEKIVFLKNVSKGKIELNPKVKEPDLSKLTDAELRRFEALTQKYDFTNIDSLEKETITDDDMDFMQEIINAIRLRESGFGSKEENN